MIWYLDYMDELLELVKLGCSAPTIHARQRIEELESELNEARWEAVEELSQVFIQEGCAPDLAQEYAEEDTKTVDAAAELIAETPEFIEWYDKQGM